MSFLDKINITEFFIKNEIIAGDLCTLVCPIAFPKWTPDNLIYRSSIWNQAGEPVSLSFPKFFNEGEAPDLYPNPLGFKDWKAIEKIDGSALIVSHYKEQRVVRTRGTFDARGMEKNGFEVDLLIEKYPKAFNVNPLGGLTMIYEWVSPLNQIVIRYNEPDIYLVGAINHEDYSLCSQSALDFWAKEIGVKRPQIFEFKTIKEASETVKQFQGKEGIVLYYNDDQNMIKIKGNWYLKLHSFKGNANLDSVIELFVEYNMPDYGTFKNIIVSQFDYECFKMIEGFISKVVDAWKEVFNIVTGMKNFVLPLKDISRKEAALKIQSSYGITNRSTYCFVLLDGKELSKQQYIKLIWQVLKK